MKYRYFLSFLIGCIVFFSYGASAQLVGDNAFLRGQWLQACIAPNGSWGNTMPVPVGYTSRAGSSLSYTDPITGTTPAGNGLDFSYDQGHDGFATGTPPWYGAYFLPGTPFNGWSIQIDDTMSSAFYSSGGVDTTLGGVFGGTVAAYSGPSCWSPNAATAGTWQGTVGLKRSGLRKALQVMQVNEVDTLASWLNVTTKFYNTTDSVLKGVYYMATGDPDNDEDLPGGSFPTNNHIAYQGGPLDRHEVWGRPPSIHQDAFSGLATQDCRAVALIYQNWPPSMVTSNDLDKVWGLTTTAAMCPCYYTLGATTLSQDIAYGLVFKIGDIAPHDSAFISFAWIFSDTSAVDSIFTVVPSLSTEGKVHSTTQPDTVLACTMSGCNVSGDSLFVADILNGQNRKWTFSKWTWSPSTGLSASTGTRVTVNIKKLAGPTVYTITGTPDITRGSCNPPAPVTFTMYVQPCFSASNNLPCQGDTLKLIGTGDTSGATFIWSGPGGFTSTGQSTYRAPITFTDTGIYMLVKTVGTFHDTVYTHAGKVKPLPVVTAGSNSPICSGAPNTLLLTATPDSLGETFSWTGPNGFTSGLQNPSIANPPVKDGGTYKVVTTWNGCTDSGFVLVEIDSTPALPTISSNTPVCSQHDSLKLTSSDATPGVTYLWTGPGGFTSTLKNPVIPGIGTPGSGVYTVTVTLGKCKNTNTTTSVVDSTPAMPILTSNSPVCSGTALNLTAATLTGSTYSWTGPNSFTSILQNPTINPAWTPATGIYTVIATFTYPGHTCSSDAAIIFAEVDSTPLVPIAFSNSPGSPGVSICQGDTLKLYSADSTAGVTFLWTGPASFTSTEQNPIITKVLPSASGVYTVVATLGGKCSALTTITVNLTPAPPLTATSNSPVCSGSADTLFLQAFSTPGATYSWSGPYTFSTTDQNPSRSPVLTEYDGIYQVTVTLFRCSTTVNDTVVIIKTPPAPWVKWLTFCQYYPPAPIQAMGDNILWYMSVIPPLKGTPVPPVPNTNYLGETYYYATQSYLGCVSAIDSIKITVFPKPVITISSSIGVCPHDTAVLTVTDTDPLAYYHWTPGLYLSDTASPVIVVRPETDIHYTVVASNMYGCSDTAHVSVSVKSGAVLNLGDSVLLYPGEKYQISPATNCSYFSWFPSAGLSNAHISNPIASPEVSTKYIVHGMTSQGCRVTDSIDIYVSAETALALPNAFTPGNGPNGEFKIIKRGIATLKDFSVYDRWGVKVFQTTDINAGWDGTYKGTPQPFGVYIYQVSAVTSTGQGFVKKGNVTLIR